MAAACCSPAASRSTWPDAGPRPAPAPSRSSSAQPSRSDAAAERQRKKDLARIESQLEKVTAEIDRLHANMAGAATDFARLAEMDSSLRAAEARRDELEDAWLEAAE